MLNDWCGLQFLNLSSQKHEFFIRGLSINFDVYSNCFGPEDLHKTGLGLGDLVVKTRGEAKEVWGDLIEGEDTSMSAKGSLIMKGKQDHWMKKQKYQWRKILSNKNYILGHKDLMCC